MAPMSLDPGKAVIRSEEASAGLVGFGFIG